MHFERDFRVDGDVVIDWTVREVAETGSTNTDLLAMVDAGTAVDHLVLRTDHQTAGRGRLDRRWDAPPGSNLLVSMLFLDPPPRPQMLPQAVGVAAVRALDHWLGDAPSDARASLKWPNDVLVGDRKLAGVLAQRHASGPIVVGIGLNVGWAPEGAASVAAVVEDPPSPAEVLARLLAELSALSQPDGHLDDVDVLDAVRERLSTAGAAVRVELPGDAAVTGRALGMDDDGALLVETDAGAVERFEVGDVIHLRPAE